MKIDKIKSIRKIQSQSKRYDLEVEDNHNYFANGILVHNCRCLITVNGDKVVLTSRKGKVFPHMEHLHSQTKALIDNCSGELILDGELFSSELTFQRIVGLVKRVTLTEEDKNDMRKIYFQLYDCIFPDNPLATFQLRYKHIENLMSRYEKFAHIKLTKNHIVRDEEEMKRLHDVFVQDGEEGIILRNFDGIYAVNKRSKDLQKYKHFQDDEFEIVSFSEGVGRSKGTVIWRCITEEGKEFNIRPKGTEEERREYFENGSQYVGQMLTVRFFDYSEDRIPIFPVGLAIRSYE